MALSNGVFLTVFDIPPLQGNGWEVQVLSYADIQTRATTGATRPIAVISTFQSVAISPAISDVGSGSITLDLDAEFWSTTLADGTPASNLREYEHVWQVFEDGALRFEFLGQKVEEGFEADDETRTITISGPGGADVLRWGKVMLQTYPYPPTETQTGQYLFTRTAMMDTWLQLFRACVNRGTLGFITPTFTAVVDSYGAPWEDNPLPLPTTGTTTTTFSGDVFFDSDKFNLKPAAKTALNAFCAKITGTDQNPNFVIVGHTDSTNTLAYNQTLSENRANSVAAYIRTKIPAAVMNVSGRGETQPVATNRTSAGRAKNRRVVITYTPSVASTVTDDSDVTYIPTLGIDLLALLKEDIGDDPNTVAKIRAEFFMRPNFRLDVVQAGFGQRRENDIVFYEGSTNTLSKSRSRDRTDISNLVAVQNAFGNLSIARSSASIGKWLQRELYSQEGALDDTVRGRVAMKTLELNEDELSVWTIAVAPYGAGRRVFVDYGLGDWIGVSQYHGTAGNTVDAFRVHAISVKVGSDGNVDLELTLQSTRDIRFRTLQEQIIALNNAPTGVKLYFTNDPPLGANIGDLWTPTPTVFK